MLGVVLKETQAVDLLEIEKLKRKEELIRKKKIFGWEQRKNKKR
jgi:hypothetical protein